MFVFEDLTSKDVNRMLGDYDDEYGYYGDDRGPIPKATTETLHQILKFPDLHYQIIKNIVDELLVRHQFTVDDFQNFYNFEQIVDDNPYNFYDYFSDPESMFDGLTFIDDNAERIQSGPGRRVRGSDLTENDIYLLMNNYFSIINWNNGLWGFYVLLDRFKNSISSLRLPEDVFERRLDFKIKKKKYEDLAYLANVNPNFAMYVYGKVADNPQLIEKIEPHLNSVAKEIFDNEQSLDELPPHQKRWHPEIPRLQELSYLRADPKKVAKEMVFIPDLRPW